MLRGARHCDELDGRSTHLCCVVGVGVGEAWTVGVGVGEARTVGVGVGEVWTVGVGEAWTAGWTSGMSSLRKP